MNPIIDGHEMDGCGEMVFKSINVKILINSEL